MSRLTSIKRLVVATLATGAVVMACRAAQPGEAQPLAPRPEAPSEPTANPVPGAPDPLDPAAPGPNYPTEDAGIDPTATNPGPVSMTEIDPPVFKAQRSPDAGVPRDAGAGGVVNDAASDAGTALPPVGDARLPSDAAVTPPPS